MQSNDDFDADGNDSGLPATAGGPLWRIPEWCPDLPEDVLSKFKTYQMELIRFNGRMNLISPRTEHESDLVHFLDCILGSRLILNSHKYSEIYDIGSGNGLPGLIMAILDTQRRVVMIDKDSRKVEFLKYMIGVLKLKNAEAKHTRLEDLPEGCVNMAVSRAFSPLSKGLIAARKASKLGCKYFHFKGVSWPKEIAEIPIQVCAFWEPALVGEYTLPSKSSKMSILVTTKTA